MQSAASAENRLDHAFARLRAAGEKGFIAYIAGGDPDLAATLTLAAALEGVGVDILELGVPFSDPLADGPVNQAAAGRALGGGRDGRGHHRSACAASAPAAPNCRWCSSPT